MASSPLPRTRVPAGKRDDQRDATDLQMLRQTLRHAVTRETLTHVVALQTPLRAMAVEGNAFVLLTEWREMLGVSLHGEGKWEMAGNEM